MSVRLSSSHCGNKFGNTQRCEGRESTSCRPANKTAARNARDQRPPLSKELETLVTHFEKFMKQTCLVVPNATGQIRVISSSPARRDLENSSHLGFWEEFHTPLEKNRPVKEIAFGPSYRKRKGQG
jgi:hypothetical protein